MGSQKSWLPEVSANTTRWVLMVSLPLSVLIGARMLAHADYVPQGWSQSEQLSATKLTNEFKAIEKQLADPDCPMGYISAGPAGPTGSILCKKDVDEVVKVGTGNGAFWIDHYEATIWDNLQGTGTPLGMSSDSEYPATFPKNGQSTVPLYALSIPGQKPSAHMTWFQAAAACAASGKQLPSRQQWLLAARGTADPGDSSGAAGVCRTGGGSTGPRNTGGGTECQSDWGAQDMIGNLWEWTDEWYAGTAFPGNADGTSKYGASYNSDGVWGVSGAVNNGTANTAVPAAALRGGEWSNGTSSGLFALALTSSPSVWSASSGFRCSIGR